jgi:hypothetical protein
MHGIRKILADNSNAYYESAHGIKVVPHSGSWIGYYHLGEWCKLALTAFCEGKAPGELTIAIRSYEDLQAATNLSR